MNDYPYVGPRFFEREEADRFFGRNGESRLLVSMVLANQVVLLYAASGAGKTSLLNAGVVPVLEAAQHFEVLPRARFGGPGTEDPGRAGAGFPFLDRLLAAWRTQGVEPGGSLHELLARRPHPPGPDGYPCPRALVIDQFEELFILHPERWRERSAVFDQLADALEGDPLLRLILVIREDYLAQLEPYRRRLPDRLERRLRLELLSPQAALEAVTRPLAGTRRRFAPGVAERLVADLRKTSIKSDAGKRTEFESEYVEPVHLQLICSELLSELPLEVTEITHDHVGRLANVDLVLTEFYDAAIAAAARGASTDEGQLRKCFADTFITTMDTRGTAYRSGDRVGNVPVGAVEELERRRLVRAEWRAHARWYELTHDRLIEPVQRSNQADSERHRRLETRRLSRRSARLLAALVVVSVAAVGLLIYVWNPGALRKLELSTVDMRFRLRGDRAPDPRVRLVAIDSASANKLKSGHVRRKFANVIDRVTAGGPRLIVVDIVFPPRQKRAERVDDPALRAAIVRAGPRLVLAFRYFSLEEGKPVQPTLFLDRETLNDAGVAVGYDGLPSDPGGVLRRVDYEVSTEGRGRFPTLASVAASRVAGVGAGDHPPRAPRRAWGEQTRDTTWIDYSGGTLTSSSFADVLDGRVAPSDFRDKVVVLGDTASVDDRHPTPFGDAVAGPTIQAEAISTLLQGAPLRDAPVPIDLAVVAAMVFVPVVTRRLALGLRLAVTAATAAAWLLIVQLVFGAGWILSLVPPLGALLLSLLATLLLSSRESRIADVTPRLPGRRR